MREQALRASLETYRKRMEFLDQALSKTTFPSVKALIESGRQSTLEVVKAVEAELKEHEHAA